MLYVRIVEPTIHAQLEFYWQTMYEQLAHVLWIIFGLLSLKNDLDGWLLAQVKIVCISFMPFLIRIYYGLIDSGQHEHEPLTLHIWKLIYRVKKTNLDFFLSELNYKNKMKTNTDDNYFIIQLLNEEFFLD